MLPHKTSTSWVCCMVFFPVIFPFRIVSYLFITRHHRKGFMPPCRFLGCKMRVILEKPDGNVGIVIFQKILKKHMPRSQVGVAQFLAWKPTNHSIPILKTNQPTKRVSNHSKRIFSKLQTSLLPNLALQLPRLDSWEGDPRSRGENRYITDTPRRLQIGRSKFETFSPPKKNWGAHIFLEAWDDIFFKKREPFWGRCIGVSNQKVIGFTWGSFVKRLPIRLGKVESMENKTASAGDVNHANQNATCYEYTEYIW